MCGKSSPALFFFVPKKTIPSRSRSLPCILCWYMLWMARMHR